MQQVTRRQVFRAYDATADAADDLRFCPRCGAVCVGACAGGRVRPRCPECSYVHYRNPTAGVAIVVAREGHVLLGKRAAAATFGGKWAFPAGFIEFDEDFLTAARREAKEETGLDVAVTGILNVTSNHLTRHLHALVVAVAATPIGGTMTAGDDLCALRWVPLGGPFPPLAYEADAALLQLLASGAVPHIPVDARYATADSG